MSTIHVRGIAWNLGRKDGKSTFTHANIIIAQDPKTETYRAKDQDGTMILARELASDAIKDTTVLILDAYASRISPSWEG